MNMRFLHSLACWLTTLVVVVVVFGTNRSQNPQAIEQGTLNRTKPLTVDLDKAETSLVNRIVVALDVRTNDHGDLVVTKGDQYDVRENHKEGITTGRGCVRNLGKPVALAQRYYEEGGDEIAFLNITSFRQGVIEDMPMLPSFGASIEKYLCSPHGRRRDSFLYRSQLRTNVVRIGSGVSIFSRRS